jgi:hypothetical protein
MDTATIDAIIADLPADWQAAGREYLAAYAAAVTDEERERIKATVVDRTLTEARARGWCGEAERALSAVFGEPEGGTWLYSNGRDRDGFDRDGYTRSGYDRDGYNRQGINADGVNREGLDKLGLDPYRFNLISQRDRDGYDSNGFNAAGLNRAGRDHEGYDADGVNEAGETRWKYDANGYDRDGFNRYGDDRFGYSRTTVLSWTPEEQLRLHGRVISQA